VSLPTNLSIIPSHFFYTHFHCVRYRFIRYDEWQKLYEPTQPVSTQKDGSLKDRAEAKAAEALLTKLNEQLTAAVMKKLAQVLSKILGKIEDQQRMELGSNNIAIDNASLEAVVNAINAVVLTFRFKPEGTTHHRFTNPNPNPNPNSEKRISFRFTYLRRHLSPYMFPLLHHLDSHI